MVAFWIEWEAASGWLGPGPLNGLTFVLAMDCPSAAIRRSGDTEGFGTSLLLLMPPF